MTRIFGGILPYEAEVAEPNGTRIAAWVLADYADRADAIFQKWLAEHDAAITQQAKAEALREAADEVDSLYFGPDQHTPFTRGAAYLWGAKQAAQRVRARADRIEGDQP